ncbi:Ccdc55 protein [Coprinopsis marcescibilis]|uniref:Ccdc55 protein n=1 Tax=Coprinopsis marcescibilis TaxID=230819 RepID=A0A5C3LDH5_COPMA|nr:Ccdc55 protein [Coprinopsis marcescibilis]
MKLSFSLKAKKDAAKPPPPRPNLFAAAEEDGEGEQSTKPVTRAYAVEASKAMQKRIEQEKSVDPTVYDYDDVWERMQELKQKQKEAKAIEALERKPKYINNLLTSAATRKLDHLRAEEKMMQRERELEGDEFKDKEAFVTQAYKDQLAEIRRAEEEEKQREEAEKKKRGGTSGMVHFYRKLLETTEQQHEAAMAASEKPVQGPQGPAPNLTISKPPEPTALSDLELAKLAREEGKDVELNDDNQIVDKRDLLAAGLNLSLPNTRHLSLRKGTDKSKSEQDDAPVVHTAVGTAASRREINERRAREVQRQMEDERRRVEDKKRQAEQEALQRTVAKRNTEEDVMSAKERYLQRKRQRLEQTQASTSEDAPS